ncbi:hypothetical protein VPNG_09766 [Cytospora leucostoma]|uniref:Uncharacterized protein n=1 Tax=Cytospora leucostoma TaxID=1230097 RepID=A0A423VLM2_9PEZI|nr:hypothetical protein VPNG_09766 [Cytospora leucostoma]
MAAYQKPTVEEVEDEARVRFKDTGIRVSVATVTAEARRPRKRKCPWESMQPLGKAIFMPTAYR